MKLVTIESRFVKSVPEKLEQGVAYVSMEYASVIHLCCCGCNNEVVTPLSPIDWQLSFDGESITLYPSIGNWGFHCRSHYWIRGNKVEYAPQWTDREIEEGRAYDRWLKTQRYSSKHAIDFEDAHMNQSKQTESKNILGRIRSNLEKWLKCDFS